jgi:hypothetical protein
MRRLPGWPSLDHNVLYLIPTINPDGRDRWFHRAQTMHSSRTGLKPYDNDRDGTADEDDVDDLDGNGSIAQMRIKDPTVGGSSILNFPIIS